MTKRFLFISLVLTLAVASAKTYSIALFQPAVVAGTELKPGDYQLDFKEKDGCATPTTAASTRCARSIRLGGTKVRLVFD